MPTLHALLLTDVVDSTRLTEELGDAAMAALWTVHDRVARDLLPAWHGREIDKTDGMLLLFDDVTDAVGYALAYHRALAARELPFKARAGIHVGPVSRRPNTPEDVARGAKPVEVDGLALPIAARVMSVALGAQTLLSADARLALGVAPQRVVSHGHWRMHGVADPVELFEVGETGEGSIAPFKAPPDSAKVYRVMRQGDLWQPVREVRHSVPAERDSFVGREEPLRVLAKKFDDGARLVSVLGMGGTGKTRLVTRFAWTVLGDYAGGVWFCDLSQARTVDGIHFAVAQGLDVPLGKTDPVVQLAHAIAGRGRCLVILDNFEQVARFAEETLGRWLDRAPNAQFVVTTREVLGIVGEDMLALEPLPLNDAAQLFVRRAELARMDYVPTQSEQDAIAQLVKVLDGLPLAIELAAARVRIMSPQALLDRMGERFLLLRSRSGRIDRQATLRAAFDWSWELLNEGERAALAQLSVFEGGFTLRSATAVLSLSPEAATSPFVAEEMVQSLVDKSFVRVVTNLRFDLLESVREYAFEHLRTPGYFVGSGDFAPDATRLRHAQFFAEFDEVTAESDRCVEANNLVAACRWSAGGEPTIEQRRGSRSDLAVNTLLGAWFALRLTGPYRVAAELALLVRERRQLHPAQRAWVAWVEGSALELLGEGSSAEPIFTQGIEWAMAGGDQRCRSRLLLSMATRQGNAGLTQAAQMSSNSALVLAKELGDRRLTCLAHNLFGRLAEHGSRSKDARASYENALACARELNDQRLIGGLLGNLGGLHHDEGRLDEARSHYDQALDAARRVGDRHWEGNAHCNLGLLLFQQEFCDIARFHLEEALRIARAIGHARLECTALCNLGLVLEAEGKLEDALEHFERAVAGAAQLGDLRSQGQFSGYLGKLQARLGNFEQARRHLTSGEQMLRAVGDDLSLATLLCQLAQAEQVAGRKAEASVALSGAQEIATALEMPVTSDLGQHISIAWKAQSLM